ncbi:tyrosine phosphatase family protein [Rhodoplanes roseus]|uniref:Protein tyrosine phosphatase n=1 Tax=Rhodoplanes roseus TaxID=29409 RepID=A0A327L779_9BRAD|nr:protein-tyrosine phosphatase family protein [Rhodoplanes roseus]RAI45773.1 protein tyrosine phosphatase [Rhodoplanes roseus]
MIHVCSLARLKETVEATGARRVVTLIDIGTPVTRPDSIDVAHHLHLEIHDISLPLDGYIHPQEQHVAKLIEFVRAWDQASPLVVHCYAGISRSTAAAYTAACTIHPDRDERDIARALRAASPTACPNRLIVSLADRLLGRDGRMVAAIESIMPHTPCLSAEPFCITLD